MQLIWVEDSFPKKDRSTAYQLDSSRTTDSISNIYNPDEISNKEIGEISKYNQSKNRYNIKNEEIINLKNDLKQKKNKFFNINFKKYLSFSLGTIYFLLFLISVPKTPIKISEEKNIQNLIKNNSNTNINILINHFNFFSFSQNKEQNDVSSDNRGITDINSNNKINNQEYQQETSGFLLEFKSNKMFIFRWLIGFFYFVIKCICFIYSNNEDNDNLLLDKNKISLIQKVSMLLFPLSLFYYDLQNNIIYSEIKTEYINKKIIKFYIMNTKRFSMIDYVEGLIPTLFYFLISIDYNHFEKIINNKKQKLNKLI